MAKIIRFIVLILCSDNAGTLALDAQIEISNPAEGTYRLWVGSAHPHQLLPTVLVLTTRSDVTLSNFDLGNLVKRPPVPAEGSAAPGEKQPNAVTDAIARFKGALGGALGATPLTQEINSAGTLGAFELDFDNAICNGFIAETPDYVFDVSSALDRFSVLFAGEQDSTLLVVGPDGQVVCNDDAVGDENVNPVVTIENPAQGRYGVFVGRLDLETPVTGILSITTDPNATPAVLPPSQ